jgi:GNAT superfamily N-acetyltransferase
MTDVVRVLAASTYPLRHRVLHPELAPHRLELPGDEREGAVHLAAYDVDGGLVGVVSVIPEAPEWDPELPGPWRLRGMATAPEVRRQGVGAQLVAAVIDVVQDNRGGWLWCTARLAAVGFYQRLGFETRGGTWEEPIIGTHIAMLRPV